MIFQWVRIYDKSPPVFDISTMEGAINYSSFVARITKDHAAELRERLKSKQCEKRRRMINESLGGDSEVPDDIRWNMIQVHGTAEDTNKKVKASRKVQEAKATSK